MLEWEESTRSFDQMTGREWLVTNGTGGFASGTVSGAPTRRYHALLVAALGSERMALLSKVDETVSLRGDHFNLSTNRYPNNVIYPDGWRQIASFSALPVPTWVYRLKTDVARGGEVVLVKRVYMAPGKNTVYVTYTLREPEDPTRSAGVPSSITGGVTLILAPLVCWKSYHTEMHPWQGFPHDQHAVVGGWSFQAAPDAPPLRLLAQGAGWTKADWWNESIVHSREQERGLDFEEDLYCPALATLTLRGGQSVSLVATIESEPPQDAMLVLADTIARQKALVGRGGSAAADEIGRELVIGADPFRVRTGTTHRATILAGYPWFTDWGRDACIALPGLCLTTGQTEVAREILQTFAGALSDGMIPNRFPDAGETPDYNTVDATLWFVHACNEYQAATGGSDTEFQTDMVPFLTQILAAYQNGTRYGIKMDESDALLTTGEAGVQLTWMDAKIGDWVVTPRTGKTVEVNALWINALRIGAAWQLPGDDYAAIADRAAQSFVAKFVRPDGLGLYDFIAPDGSPNTQIRPNQILATALSTSPCSVEIARMVLETVQTHLLTPVGLRSLAPSDPAYQGQYAGDSRQRDGAYHQGTVWAWLIGSFVDTYRRVHGKDADVAPFLSGLEAQLREYGIGGIGEIFEGNDPHRPDGCPWQAWSVAELLRVRTPAAP